MSAAPILASTRAACAVLRRFGQSRRAATAVEFALLIPVLAQSGVGIVRLSDSLAAPHPAAMVGSTIATDLRTGRTSAP